jgi:hypothetical protein
MSAVEEAIRGGCDSHPSAGGKSVLCFGQVTGGRRPSHVCLHKSTVSGSLITWVRFGTFASKDEEYRELRLYVNLFLCMIESSKRNTVCGVSWFPHRCCMCVLFPGDIQNYWTTVFVNTLCIERRFLLCPPKLFFFFDHRVVTEYFIYIGQGHKTETELVCLCVRRRRNCWIGEGVKP